MEGLVGSCTGSYRIMRLLTQGDTAEIYLGEDTQTNRRATLKIISFSIGEDSSQQAEKQVEKETAQRTQKQQAEKKSFQWTKKQKAVKKSLQPIEKQTNPLHEPHIKRLQAEASLLARFNHLHIIRALEMGITENAVYIAQEYIHNASFYQHHPKGSQLPERLVLSYIQQIAETLHYLHSLKVFHRHLKPEHILLAPANRVVLCGFGQAISPWETPQDAVPALKGTQTYMAPEQFQGTSLPASDQYALAIMAYEWFCGEPPFTGSSEELEHEHLHTPPPSMIKKRARLSPAIEQAVLLALAKDPQRRFATVSAFAHALEQAVL